MTLDLNKIANEWSYRVGVIDIKNPKHIYHLNNILNEYNVSHNVVNGIIHNIINEVKISSKDNEILTMILGDKFNDKREDIVKGKYKSQPLSAGSGNTFSTQKQHSLNDIKKYSRKTKIIVTTAGTVKKIRTQYGDRIAQLMVSKSKNPKDKYFGQVYTFYQVMKLSGIQVRERVAPGIGYETMQIDNLDDHLNSMLDISKHKPLSLFINGKDSGVDIDGGVKVPGSPKADLAFGIKNKANFWVSYKHGEYKDSSGKELKSSFQQYGTLKTFYTKEFNSALEDTNIGNETDSFLNAVVKSATHNLKNVSGVDRNEKDEVVLTVDGKQIISPTQNKQIWGKNFTWLSNALKRVGKTNLHIIDESGFSRRRSLLKMGNAGKDISMLAIFGKDYGSGKAGVNNVNVLMQDATAFGVDLMTDENGNARGVNIKASSKGHVMFNPDIYSGVEKFPKFAENYEPFFVVRYTGEMNVGWNNGKDIIIGGRVLIMPRSQTKEGTDI